jgi:DnaJ-domain-containing protein 1
MPAIVDGYVQGLGPETLVPKVRGAGFPGIKLSAEEGFVLSRIDGHTKIGQLVLLVPFEAEVTVVILKRLLQVGAIEIPGAEISVGIQTLKPETPAPTMGDSLLDGIDLTVEQARRIDDFYASLERRDAFELLETTRDADKKEIKRAYFKLSKEFHPDRFFGKTIGPYRERLSRIFQSVKQAFELLSDDARRTAYLESVQQK